MKTDEKPIYTLIPIEDFKALMGIDDREDKLAKFCLITATLTIEQYCKRKLLRKKHFERIAYAGDLLLPLWEYSVSKVLCVYLMSNEQRENFNYSLFYNPPSAVFCFSIYPPWAVERLAKRCLSKVFSIASMPGDRSMF